MPSYWERFASHKIHQVPRQMNAISRCSQCSKVVIKPLNWSSFHIRRENIHIGSTKYNTPLMSFTGASFFNKWIRISVCCWDLAIAVENKQGTLSSWVKPCTSETETGVVKQTIRTNEQPRNENDLEPSTTITGKLETTKTQLIPPDQVFVNVSDSPYQPKNFKDLRE